MSDDKIPRICFVQFPHPGAEHAPQKWQIGTQVPWNRSKHHHRKFLLSSGCYIDKRGRLRKGQLVFWGEWEPPSNVMKTWSEKGSRPILLQRPVWKRQKPGEAQNTDPWVFGECFRYSNCNQFRGKRRTFLQRLAPGSIILFGSTIGKERKKFVLDTLFVVKHRYEPGRAPKTDEAFRVCTVDTLPSSDQFILYSGATYKLGRDDMYSFVPCRRRDASDFRFERPVISLGCYMNPKTKRSKPYINPDSKQSPRRVEVHLNGVIREQWEKIRKQVLRHWMLGVSFPTPSLDKGISRSENSNLRTRDEVRSLRASSERSRPRSC